jgi:hypothetical protein
MAISTSPKVLSSGGPSSSTSLYRQSADEKSTALRFTLDDRLNGLFSCTLPSTYSDTTSELLSITPSSSACQTTNDDPNDIPRISGTTLAAHRLIYNLILKDDSWC